LLPVLQQAQERAQTASCLNNRKQLEAACILYSSENSDFLPLNIDMRNNPTITLPQWVNGVPGYASDALITWDAGANSANTNLALLLDGKYSDIAKYVGYQPKIYLCPADDFASPAQRQDGWPHRDVTCAMDASVGGGPKYPSIGYTLYTATKDTRLLNPGPANVWVLTDEQPDFLDDNIFYTCCYDNGAFSEIPGNLHGGASGISFADGHAEVHAWQGPVVKHYTTVHYVNGETTYSGQLSETYFEEASGTDPDLNWLGQKTPGNPNGSSNPQ
jgi:prepilin-type processing-associated H-X9-DG protein